MELLAEAIFYIMYGFCLLGFIGASMLFIMWLNQDIIKHKMEMVKRRNKIK